MIRWEENKRGRDKMEREQERKGYDGKITGEEGIRWEREQERKGKHGREQERKG